LVIWHLSVLAVGVAQFGGGLVRRILFHVLLLAPDSPS